MSPTYLHRFNSRLDRLKHPSPEWVYRNQASVYTPNRQAFRSHERAARTFSTVVVAGFHPGGMGGQPIP